MRDESPDDPIELDPDVYALVTDARRVVLLQHLQARGAMTARELARLHGTSPGACRHHLTELQSAGWVRVVRQLTGSRGLPANVWDLVPGVDWRAAVEKANELPDQLQP